MKRNMTNIIKSSLLSLLLIGLFSCSDGLSENEPVSPALIGKTALTVNTTGTSLVRTLYPSTDASILSNFVLKGKKSADTEEPKQLGTAKDMAELKALVIEFNDADVGSWDFTLTGSYSLGDTVLTFSDTQTATIKANTLNSVAFKLKLPDDSTQHGGLSISVSFTDEKASVSKVIATLKTEDKSETIETKEFVANATGAGSAIETVEGNEKKITFSRDMTDSAQSLESGTYYLLFEFFSNGMTETLNTLPNFVRIQKGLTTAANLSLVLDEIYTITYVDNGGTLDSGVKTEKYSRKSSVRLPLMKKANHTFIGWYETESFEGDPITEINQGTIGNLTLYAKYEEISGTALYVGMTSASTEASDTEGTGSIDKPFATLNGAVEYLAANGNAEEAYDIRVTGTLTTMQTLDSTIDGKAKSIRIIGSTGLDADGVPQDAINRGVAGEANSVSNGMALVIKTSVPVTINNLKITGGYGSGENAGGINIAEGATVMLGDGVLVTGNRNPSNGRGGGIHNEGTLFIYGSAIIGDKNATAYATDSSSYNDFNNGRMANYASAGGGIYNGNASSSTTVVAKLYLGYNGYDSDGVTPIKEELTGGLYFNSGSGGALCNVNGSFVYFDSGTFAWNGTDGSGGAIYNERGTVEMSGGQIIHNRSFGLNNSYGGGVCNAKDTSVFIMSGGTINQNEATRNGGYGGGVYNCGKFYMCGTAVIGDKDATSVATEESYGNIATYGGGIYTYVNTSSSQNGCAYLGYRPDADGTPIEAELTGGIYHNYASNTGTLYEFGGGAIGCVGTLKIASGTLAWNASARNGGAIYYSKGANHSLAISGGTIENNAAGEKGGAIYIASTSDSVLTLSGTPSIPAGTDGKQDVYMVASKSYYPKITLESPMADDFAVRLTLSSYDTAMKILALAEESGTTFAAECEKFNLTPETVTDETTGKTTTTIWYINESGTLERYNKAAPNAVGDIVLSDGTAITGKYAAKMSAEEKSRAAAVIFYAGSTSAQLGSRLLGVGIKNTADEETTAYDWAGRGTIAGGSTAGYSIDFEEIRCEASSSKPSGTSYSYNYNSMGTKYVSGDFDGSDNWAKICAADSGATTDTSYNYPAFNWVNTYAQNHGLSGTKYEAGWFMPTIVELLVFYGVKDTVNPILEAIGGTQIASGDYWAASQAYSSDPNADRTNYACFLTFYENNPFGVSFKTTNKQVCAIREFGATMPVSNITISTSDYSNDISVEQAQNGSEITFTADEGYGKYTWFIDDETNDAEGNAYSATNILAFDTENWTPGVYEIRLEATTGTGYNIKYYSYSAQITVSAN